MERRWKGDGERKIERRWSTLFDIGHLEKQGMDPWRRQGFAKMDPGSKPCNKGISYFGEHPLFAPWREPVSTQTGFSKLKMNTLSMSCLIGGITINGFAGEPKSSHLLGQKWASAPPTRNGPCRLVAGRVRRIFGPPALEEWEANEPRTR